MKPIRAIRFPFFGWKWFGVPKLRRAKRATRKSPDDANAHYELGMALGQNFDLDKALAQSVPGGTLSTKGLTLGSIEELRKAIELNPAHIEAHVFLACHLRDEGQSEEAIEVCRQCMRLLPPDEIAVTDRSIGLWNDFMHEVMGNALNDLGRRQEARQEWLRAVEIGREAAYYSEEMLEKYPEEP